MTSRRTVLGVLAAAPFARPVIAEAMASPKYHFGGVIGESRWGLVGEACTDFVMTPRQIQALTLNIDASGADPDMIARLQRHIGNASRSAIPNRLHGAYINEDGEAV